MNTRLIIRQSALYLTTALALGAAQPGRSATTTYAEARLNVPANPTCNTCFDSQTGGAGGAMAAADSTSGSEANGRAKAAPGTLGVSTLAIGNGLGEVQSRVQAQWTDSFPMFAPGHSVGTRGSFDTAFTIDGNLFGTIMGGQYARIDTYIVANVSLDSGIDGGSFSSQGGGRLIADQFSSVIIGLQSFTLRFENVPFEFGREISVSLRLQAVTGVDLSMAGTDYSHTMRWAGMSNLRDSTGSPIVSFSALSPTSGFNFALPAPVPEPATVVLFHLGVCGILFCARRRERLAAR